MIARRTFPGCPSLCGYSGILTWNSEGSSGKPALGSGPAIMADRDCCGDAWFFRFTMNVANWSRMRVARWMAAIRVICFRRDFPNRRWFLIFIARSSLPPARGCGDRSGRILRLPKSASSRQWQRGGFDGSEHIRPTVRVGRYILSRVGCDAGRRRCRAAGQPGVGRAVAGRPHGVGAGGLATRPTVKRGHRTDSAQRQQRCCSITMALQFRFG